MALDRIGPANRPLSVPDRPQTQPGQVTRVPGSEGPFDPDFATGPLGPAAPTGPTGPNSVGAILDGPDTAASPAHAEALAAALAEAADVIDAAAMRPNQVFLSRQLVWQPPDTSAMAASWQIMVRTYGEQRAAWLEQASGQHLPASLFMTEQLPASLRDGRPGLPLVTEMEPWRFAVYAWGAERLVLKVVVKDDDEYDRNRRKRTRVALRLELTLPGLGRVVIQLEPASANGVVMEIGAAQTAVMQHMRDILPQVAAVVSRAGLTILRCRLRRELPAAGGEHAYPSRMHTATLTQAVFKAMAEVAVLLSQPTVADELQ
ncbi:hypothetical protein [Duganella callida]|uniref:Flagellar hook-length control protein FliK n=1 Tax=Duganella callida TaxID=2561932 RepID=A0A4Y9S9Y2_9BURK|nr:hypothetical protein [Duganella callida]TFW18561.1 hypothetical protein E4L98_17955 [Duganella callida]